MNILHLVSSPRGEASASIQLGNAIVQQLQARYPGGTLVTRDLATAPFPHLEEQHLASFFTPPEARNEAQAAAASPSEQAIAELQQADAIVIGVPMYNFNLPSTLKAWIDHVVRAGLTFSYSEAGPSGLLQHKKVYLALASGGIYSEGPMKTVDFSEPYLRHMLSFIGLSDITTYRAEGLALPDRKDTALEKAIQAIAV
ncbi:FMN-dependent NADH-azoreductase [Taibaiella chishuiensis]|uniref:FMN dependent NADH:quinone oxidoreductase n=1 Tax=Taibaiella chishuiensis TaxID=1434707 RepID=A0A2P8CX93_9BACT|nr:NAD(P)H-dependent oxidoreductase [Taibaiella chishuiensis]PSK89584.1 FMN-dependent NADH-azoreductase [Taibaiella chishuiensis]